MIVTIKSFASLRLVMPKEITRELDAGSTVADLLGSLMVTYPGLARELFVKPGHINPRVNILVNGRNIQYLAGQKTVLGDGDLVAIFPPAAGG